MENAKHRTCEECGESFEPGGFSEGWVCPTCNAAFLRRIGTRLLKAIFWGGVAALAAFLVVIFVIPGEPHEDFTFLSFMAFIWPFFTFLYLMSGGAWGGGGDGGGGDGGGGNGGGGNGGG